MLYKSVKIPDWEKIGDIVYKNLPDDYKIHGGFRSHDPILFQKCKPLVDGISIYTDWSNVNDVAVVSVPPNKLWPIHTDWKITFPFSLNIPIYNCTTETRTSFYKVKDQEKFITKNSDKKKVESKEYLEYNSLPEGHVFELEDVEEIDSYYLTEPTLYRIDVPHSIFNSGSQQRLSLSVRFREWVEF
jgi:hypothetical protein